MYLRKIMLLQKEFYRISFYSKETKLIEEESGLWTTMCFEQSTVVS
jgi:hypothetical protein